MENHGERDDKEQRDPVVQKKAERDLHQTKRQIHRVTGEAKRAAAHKRQRRLGRVNVCSGRFHFYQGRQRQRRCQDDEHDPADQTHAISHDRQPYEQVHQNADHRVHQPDQRREGDDSRIIRWLINF